MAKVIAFEVKVGGLNQVVTNFGELEQAIKDIRAELKGTDFGSSRYNELQKILGALKQTQKAVNDETRAQQQQFVKTADAGANSYRALNAELVLLRKSYKDLSEADRNSPIGTNLIKQIQVLDTKLKGIDASMGLYQRNVGNYVGALQSYFGAASSVLGSGAGSGIVATVGGGAVTALASALSGNLVGAFAVVSDAIADTGAQVVKFNADITDAQAGVQKTTGLTTKKVQELTDELKALDTRTSLKGLLGIGEILGQLGVEVNTNTISAIDKLTVALGDEFGGGTELVTAEVGKLRNVLTQFKDVPAEEAFLNIGNALNVLGATGAATSPVITDFASRIAGISGPLGITGGQILGVSATLQELGTNAERGATGFSRVIGELVKQPTEFAKQLGITKEAVQEVDASVSDFTGLVNKDLFGAFTLVLNRLKELNLSNTDFAQVLGKLSITGQGEIEVLSKLSQSQDLLGKRVATATKALGEQDSITAEFAVKNTNLAAELDKLGNIIAEKFVSGGFSDWLRDVVGGINSWFDADTKLSDQLVEQQVRINSLIYTIGQSNISTEERIDLIKQLQTEYPEYFANLDAEKVSNDELNTILLRVNDSYSKRIAIIKNNEFLQKQQEAVGEQILDIERDRARLIQETNKAILEYNRNNNDQIKVTGNLAKDIESLNRVGATRVSWTRDVAVSLGALQEKEAELAKTQKETNEIAATTLQVNARIAQSGNIINEQAVKNLITTGQNIIADKEAIRTLVEKGKQEEATAKALQVREAAQKSLNSVSKDGLDIVVKSTSGPIQQLAVQGKQAAEVVRASVAEIDKILKGTGAAPGGGNKPGTSDKTKKSIEAQTKEEQQALDKANQRVEGILEKYRNERLAIEDKFSDQLSALRIGNIKDETTRQLEAEGKRYSQVIQKIQEENDKAVLAQNIAEKKLAEAISDTEKVRDTAKTPAVRSEATKQLEDLIGQQRILEEQIAEDNIARSAKTKAILEQLEIDHGNKVNEIIKKGASRDKAEFEKRQSENFKAVNTQFADFLDQLERDFKDKEIAISKARKDALDQLNTSAGGEDITKQVQDVNEQFDTEEAQAKIQLLTDKLETLRTELTLIQAINLQELSLGLSPSVSGDDIQKVKDSIRSLEASLTEAELSESQKRIKNKEDEVNKKLELEKKYREEVRDTLLDIADQAASSLLAIEKNRLDREIQQEEDNINKTADKKVEAAQGNAAVIKQIEEQRAADLAELDRKAAEEQKDFAKKRAVIEGALAIVKAFATLGPIAGAIATVGIIATTALQIAEIDSQTFAGGGFTGTGKGRPDETGEVPVGVVHAEEYVIPKRVLKTSEGASLARRAEILRTSLGYPARPGKFATGGYVPVPTASSSQLIVQSTAQLDPEQFNQLVVAVRDAVEEGSMKGTVAGQDEANRASERQSSLKIRTQI